MDKNKGKGNTRQHIMVLYTKEVGKKAKKMDKAQSFTRITPNLKASSKMARKVAKA